MLAISPDMDLLDASGKFNPRQDGVKNSYSVGLGFTCVPATWDLGLGSLNQLKPCLSPSPPSGGEQHSPADGCGWGVFIV